MSVSTLPKLGYSINEVIEITGTSRQTVYHEINNGNLRTFKVGNRRLTSPDALKDWVKTREAATARGAA